MYAVIKTGGKQYLVKLGQKLKIEKLDKKVGEIVSFGEPLLVFDEERGGVEIGAPMVKTEIQGKVLEQAKAKKIRIVKFRAKTRYHKKQGHRQRYTLIQITKIGAQAFVPKVAKPKIAEEKADPKSVSLGLKEK